MSVTVPWKELPTRLGRGQKGRGAGGFIVVFPRKEAPGGRGMRCCDSLEQAGAAGWGLGSTDGARRLGDHSKGLAPHGAGVSWGLGSTEGPGPS